jgi:type VI secretion system protein ImpA
MPSPEVLDFEALLKPIAEDTPAGESLRYEGVYDAIQEARREEDALPMGEWQREVKVADWRAVINLGTEAIAAKSKDLQIAVWLVEALLKRHGFAGLRDGLRLLQELQEAFWDGLYPEIEDGDLEYRGGPFNWLNEKLPASVRLIALTEGAPEYGWNHWDESRKTDNLGRQNPEAMQAAIDEGKITGEQFDRAVDGTPRAFYEILIEDIADTKEQLSALEAIIDDKFGQTAPSLIKLRSAIDDSFEVAGGIVKKKRSQDPGYKAESDESIGIAAEDQALSIGGGAAAAAPGANWAGEPRSREEAFQRLRVIAAYLRRVEPQHPVTYLLERAVKWTHMPLEDWLAEVINSPDALQNLRQTLGIKEPDNA